MRQFNAAVIGAQTMVGQEFIKLLDERNFPASSVRLFTTDYYSGKKFFVKHQETAVQELSPQSFRDVDIAFFAAGPETSRYFTPLAVRNRKLVVDTSSAFRNVNDIPMVVPEINLEDARVHQGIISTPNCSTIQLAVILYPLHKINPIKRIIVDTYQSVSGKDTAAIEELNTQVKQVLDGQTAVIRVFPHQIAFNLLPEVDVFLDSGETREERKILEETRKILRSPEMAISPPASGRRSLSGTARRCMWNLRTRCRRTKRGRYFPPHRACGCWTTPRSVFIPSPGTPPARTTAMWDECGRIHPTVTAWQCGR